MSSSGQDATEELQRKCTYKKHVLRSLGKLVIVSERADNKKQLLIHAVFSWNYAVLGVNKKLSRI